MSTLETLRGLEADHAPDGWPAVQMKQISALCDEVERLRASAPPAAQPAFYAFLSDDGNGIRLWTKDARRAAQFTKDTGAVPIPLFSEVPPAARQLSDEQIDAITKAQWGEMWGAPLASHRVYARVILKESLGIAKEQT